MWKNLAILVGFCEHLKVATSILPDNSIACVANQKLISQITASFYYVKEFMKK